MDNFKIYSTKKEEYGIGDPAEITICVRDKSRCEQLVCFFRELAGDSYKAGYFDDAEEELTVAREISEGLNVFDADVEADEETEIVKLVTADGQEINLVDEKEGE